MSTPAISFTIDLPPVPDSEMTLQDYSDWLKENLVVIPTGALPGVISSAIPSTNVGLVIKSGLVYVWNDTTEAYVPLAVGPEIGEVVELAYADIDITRYCLCDGSAYPRIAPYSQLYAVIGTTFGAGDGSTTFNVPNQQGIAVESYSPAALVPVNLGDLVDVGHATPDATKQQMAMVKAIRFQ
jgi:hypothetical protein